ncbi:MOS1T transposase, partial [Pseudoatta argentina]
MRTTGESAVDITWASPSAVPKITSWKILEEETHSDHLYIEVILRETLVQIVKRAQTRPQRWSLKPDSGPQPARRHRILVQTYGDNALSNTTCRDLFRRFKNNDFELEDKERSGAPKKFEDKELEQLLDEDPSRTLSELGKILQVDESTVSKRLKGLGMIQKQGHWVPYELKPRDVERRFGTCELLLQRQKKKGFLHANRKLSYPDYTTGIEFPITLKQITKFELLNDIPSKRDDENVIGHFTWIKNLSRLIGSQLSKSTRKKYLCDRWLCNAYDLLLYRCLHYFYTSEKLSLHIGDCTTTNDCAVIFPNENDKWLSFRDHNKKERLLFVVYADLECVLEKRTSDENISRFAYQHHKAFSVGYYIRCTYDETASMYKSYRGEDCVSWFVKELYDLAHRAKTIFDENSKLKIMRSEFSNLGADDFDLLTRKGVFPYEYVDSVDKLNETSLSSRELFYSSLTDETASDDDYQHATNVWQRFRIQILGDLYLKTDVLLLADVFEKFRDTCIENYGLDPTYYYTLPGYTWDAMLKYTGIRFELLTDIDMVMFVERGIRGGLSQCSHRYAQANNKYNVSSYDPSEPSTYLMYFDVNNLYGWAMSESLPYGEFQWVDDIERFDVMSVSSDSVVGYILEVDLAYLQSVHDAHADLPFCPTRERPPGKRNDKLLATLYDKERYVVHYHNLQQCIRHGLHVRKICRILQLAQSPWLRGYIEINMRFRILANNEFEKNLYKLMNNAVFGKTMENVRDHVDVRLVTRWDRRYGAEALIAKPNFHSRSIFSENLIAVKLRKLEVKLNKPIYVDILIYLLECENVYENIKRDIARFDTSDYLERNAYDVPRVNNKIPGLMKDENDGAIMPEFIGLRAKMYALRVVGKSDTKRIKSVKKNIVAKTITFDDYARCLNDVTIQSRRHSCMRSTLHEVYTVSKLKLALSPYYDKRYVVPESVAIPWGHYKIPL